MASGLDAFLKRSERFTEESPSQITNYVGYVHILGITSWLPQKARFHRVAPRCKTLLLFQISGGPM